MQLSIGTQIASAELLDGMFQDSPMVFRVGKADGSYATTYISPNAGTMLGYPPAQWHDSPSFWQDHIHPDDLERVMREFASLFEADQLVVEYRLIGAQGGALWIRDEIKLTRFPDGAPAYLSGYWFDISTHRRQEAALLEAQQALQEKDRFLQSVLDNIPQKLFWKDRQSVFRGCNLAGARAVGLERTADIEGKTDFNLHPNPMVADYLRKTDEAVMAMGQATYHTAIPIQQGEVWLDVTKVPLCDENGAVSGLLVSYEDVSAQKKTEIALRNFKRAVEQSSNIIIITNTEGDIEYVNPRFLEVYGYTEHEVLGKNPRLLKSAATRASTYQELWQTIQSGKSWHGELVNQAKNGELSWQSTSISPIFDENGAITHFIAIEDDISEYKHNEEMLRQSEERFRTIANYTYNWENWIDPNGKLLWVNPGVERITGYTPEECYAMADYPIGMICPEDRAIVAGHYAQTLSGAGHRPLEFRFLRKDGIVRWGEVTLQQVYDANGAALGHRSSVRDITEYRQIMDKLHDTQEMLQLVLDHIPQGIFWKDRNDVYLGCNAVYAHDTGRKSSHEIKGLTDFDLFSSEEAAPFRRDDQEVMCNDHALINYEEKFTNADGVERWVLTSKVPLHNREGEVFGVLGAYTDITERRQAEAEILTIKNRLQATLDAIPDLLFEVGSDARIYRYHTHRPDLLAAPPEEFLGKTFAEILPPEVAEVCQSAILESAEKGWSIGKQYMLPLPQGDYWFELSVASMPENGDQDRHFIVLTRDITERKQVEEALRESEERWKFALEGSSEGVWDWNVQTGAAVLSKRWKEMLGFTEDEIENNADEWIKRVHPEDLPRVMAVLQAHIERKTVGAVVEFRMLCKDGSWKWILGRGMVVGWDAHGKALRLVGTNGDINERKLAEAQIRELNETLEQRVAEKTAQNMAQERLLVQQARHAAMGEMIGNIAHQWRQPLNTLGLIVQNIAYDYEEGLLDNDSLAEYRKTALDTVQKMSQTIDDFRNFFKPNHMEETFSLSQPIQDALKLIEATLQSNAITVTVDCSEHLKVHGSSNEFSQAMLNLLANAKDALMEKKALPKTITVSAREEADQIVVYVRDNGGGIPAENRDKIFDPYFTSKKSGTGIGLYMTRVIIEQHMHGKITCRNTDAGAEFLLFLPVLRNKQGKESLP